MNEIKIHDIKPLIEVPDYSMYIFYGLVLLVAIIFGLIIYFIYRFFKNRKQNIRKEYFKKLKEVDFINSKQSAYSITKYGQLLAKSDREKQLLHDLIEKLESYKYRKDVPSFDSETKLLFDNFMESLDV